MPLLQITDPTERARVMVPMFKIWKETMAVSIWGRGKATRVKQEKCRDREMVGAARYPGDCDECNFFMGARVPSKADWGSYAPACCALDMEANEHEATALRIIEAAKSSLLEVDPEADARCQAALVSMLEKGR